ncbi:helix-turn-helix domain-containing protein [Vibrio alginolyticus]|uniref:helix-turn-helix domain-containing protein n=1 Tax=Vibrio alginolyticus TaxID=663 RepID=UPI001B82B9A0|nr:helix-turn-helix transcriptional regulator [Vibrio alginolyticus]EHK6028314.1 helix-turn-helix transcriptional regulator [Vibrio parahaemolyticus]MCQ9091068.1 helix-turn-helix transcriptional regulator [Vibrio alginolyticus]HBC3831473.1 helix-turn-helix transcriptional regulator [Vibrio parahaemolyticus]HBC3992696.1 helix-turn-helix transcriptional regulator [Vibrio parahaemolyticus]
MSTFNVILKNIREKKGLKQAELARISGIAASSILHFENGRSKPSMDNLKKLSIALGVSIDYLVGNEKDATSVQDVAIYRDYEKLSDEDKVFAKDFMRRLARE